MARLAGWHAALSAYLSAVHRKPFQYGVHDCALMASTCVEILTGHDPLGPYRGKYKTLAGGLRVARRAGYDTHVDIFAQSLGEVSPQCARPGDLAVLDDDVMGVVQGAVIFVLAENRDGLGCLVTVPADTAKRCFAVC